jgi:branched-chain amino acid transport system ATP-binding protein
MAEALLELRDVRAGYAEAVVLDGISLALPDGGSLAILGRNGVGKTTLLLTVMGFVTLSRGSVWLNGSDISRLAPHRRAHLGVGWVPQEREIFPSLTVEENLTVAARPGRWDLDAIFGLFPRLQERRTNMGNQLSGGEQQMLTIARTLMTNPSVLLLDEPLEGLAPIIIEELTDAIGRMAAEHIGLVLVEQHAELALTLTEEAVIVERGVIAHQARSQDLLKDDAVLDRFLGLQLQAPANGDRGRP